MTWIMDVILAAAGVAADTVVSYTWVFHLKICIFLPAMSWGGECGACILHS